MRSIEVAFVVIVFLLFLTAPLKTALEWQAEFWRYSFQELSTSQQLPESRSVYKRFPQRNHLPHVQVQPDRLRDLVQLVKEISQ